MPKHATRTSFKKGHIPYTKGKHYSADARAKISFARKGQHNSTQTEFKGGHLPWNKGRTGVYSPEHLKHMSQIEKGRHLSPQTEFKKGRRLTESQLKCILQANRGRPTKCEARFITLITKYGLPFKYVGDGSLIIGGLCPDFANVNGRKQLIEIFGEYWHSPEVVGNRWQGSELGRIMAYNSLGFKCLIIWENELKDEKSIITKVRKFMKLGGKNEIAKQSI